MRKLLIATSAAAMLAASSFAAFAGEASGAVQSIDTTAGTVTLADGQTYVLPAGFDTASIAVGDEVTITYEESADGQMTATAVTPSS
jgi:Cu/Ag efflux protein CusF